MFSLLLLLQSTSSSEYEAHLLSEASARSRSCGTFMKDWQNPGSSTPVAIYERAPTGLADIWSSMLTAFWWAAAMERRFEVHWPESQGSIDLEANGIAHSAIGLDRLNSTYTYFKRTHLDFRAEAWSRPNTNDKVVLTGNRGLTNWAWSAGYLPQSTQSIGALRAAGCVLSRLARPTPQAYELARPLLKAIQSTPTVCLHIRAGLMLSNECRSGTKCGTQRKRPDDEMHGAKSSVSVEDVPGFIACAHNLSNTLWKDRHVKWFIAADSASLRRDFQRQFDLQPKKNTPKKILLAPWQPEPFARYQTGGGSKGGTSIKPKVPRSATAFDPNSLKRTFAEWYALAHCDAIVVSRSGFSRTAAVVARTLKNSAIRLVAHADDQYCRSPSDSRLESLLMEGGAGI